MDCAAAAIGGCDGREVRAGHGFDVAVERGCGIDGEGGGCV